MQSMQLGLEITDVPGIELIRVEPSNGSADGAHVAIKFSHQAEDAEPISFEIQEISGLIIALQMAESHARHMVDHNGE